MASEWFERAAAVYVDAGRERAVIDLEGSTLNAECRAIEALGLELEWLIAQRDAAAYADTAGQVSSDALSRWGADRYGVLRQGATSAVATLTFTWGDTGASAEDVPAGTIVRTAAGARFRVDADVGVPKSGSTAEGTATSVLTGGDQNVDAATLTAFEGTAPADHVGDAVTVTNAERAAGGNEAETDEQYLSRIRTAFVNARRGTLGAIRDGGLAVDQVREAAAYELLDDDGDPVGAVSLVISDSDGNSNSTLEAAVELSLDEYRCAGVQVVVMGATVRLEDIDYAVTWAPGQATPANALATRQAVVAMVNRLDPSGAALAADAPASSILTPGLVEAAVRTVAGVVKVDVSSPAGDVAPDQGEVIRTTLARVTAS